MMIPEELTRPLVFGDPEQIKALREWEQYAEGGKDPAYYDVSIRYTVYVDEPKIFTVLAESKEHAEEIALKRFHQTTDHEDVLDVVVDESWEAAK